MRPAERKLIRKKLREKKIECRTTLFGAKIAARKQFRKKGTTHWVFAETFGFVILDLSGVDLFNQARKKNGIRKLRERDINKISVYRFPKKALIILRNEEKTAKEQKQEAKAARKAKAQA